MHSLTCLILLTNLENLLSYLFHFIAKDPGQD